MSRRLRHEACLALLALLALACALPVTGRCADEAPPPATPADAESQKIREELDQILAQPEFRRLHHMQTEPASKKERPEVPDWLKRFFKKLEDLLTPTKQGLAGLGALWQAIAATALAVLAALIIWLVVRAVNNFRSYHDERLTRSLRPHAGEADLPPGDLPADEYLRRAEEFAQSGRTREAVGQLILGGMSRTERAGLIRFRRGLTHRDYLRALRQHSPPMQAFRTLVAIYEPICFGRRSAEYEHYHQALSAYQQGFADLQEVETL